MKKFSEYYRVDSKNGLSKTFVDDETGVRIVNMKELFGYNPITDDTEMRMVQLSGNELGRFALENDDLLFGRRSLVEEGAGKTTIYKGELPTVFESSIIRVRLDKSKANPDFVNYYFNSPVGRGSVLSIITGAAVFGIRGSDLQNLKVAFPPLPTQKKIASILSAYDDLIENNNQRIKLLEALAEEIYKEWFVRLRFPNYENVKVVDGVPEGWEKSRLENHLEYFRGKSYSSAELRDNEGLAMLNLKNINRGGGFRRDGLKYFEGKYNEANLAKSGDIIMAVTDMTQEREIVGRVAIVPEMGIDKFIISMDLIRIEPIDLPKTFLYALLRYSGIGLKFKEFANGVNVLHLTPDLIKTQRALIPSNEVCLKFTELVQPMISEIDLLANRNQILQQTRDLLLPRLISGKLSVEDINIEYPENQDELNSAVERSQNMAAEPTAPYN